MYHISNDKRAVQSADLIYNGLLQCLDHKSFDQITVTDVQKASGVARTTIYRCFDNLSDILYWRCDLAFREALHATRPMITPNELELMQGYFAYWMEHSDILKLLMDINRQDINAEQTAMQKQKAQSADFSSVGCAFTVVLM